MPRTISPADGELVLRRASLATIRRAYDFYYSVLARRRSEWFQIRLDKPPQLGGGFLRALGLHAAAILNARLEAAARIGSLRAIIERKWDPKLFEIILNDEVVGVCSFSLRSPTEVEVDGIGFVDPELDAPYLGEVLRLVKRQSLLVGANQLVARADDRRYAEIIMECGFQVKWADDILLFDLDQPHGQG
jgi:hypothetical protein